jgi:hypothetical protein
MSLTEPSARSNQSPAAPPPGVPTGLSIPQLMARYPMEAALHRNIMSKRGTGIAAAWRRFDQFLRDLGPAPDANHELRFVYDHSFVYGPGLVHWRPKDSPVEYKPRPLPLADREYSQYTNYGGKPVTYSELATSLGGEVKDIAPALNARISADELAAHKTRMEQRIDPNAAWLPPQPEKRDAFLAVYRLWSLKVRPKFAKAATPEFLFLFIAIDQLAKDKAVLVAEGLFNRTQFQGKSREDHPAWRRYCEMMPKAQMALITIPAYAAYSLSTDLEDLQKRITDAERRFRTEPVGR